MFEKQILLVFFIFFILVDSKSPHIVMIVLDDIGWSDLSYQGGKIPTPFIDKLSSEGIKLDRYYTHPLCTPSRMSLLTGRYSHMNGFGSGGIILGKPNLLIKQNFNT